MPLIFLFAWVVGTLLFPSEVPAQAITGAATYTPQQLHELLAGQSEPVVIQTFGRMPDLIRGHDWFYERMAIYVPEQDQYYTVAVVCFSQADGRVWQVVCYPH